MKHPSLAVVAVLLASGLVAVGTSRSDDGRSAEVVPLYTNADLAKLEPIPSQSEPIVQITEDWSFVNDFIRRQHERIDAEREFRLERAKTEAELDYLRNRRPRYTLPWNGFLNFGLGNSFLHDERVDGRRRALIRLGQTDVSGRIGPLHARPSQTQVRYFKATRRSGAAAMPSRPPRR